MSAEGGVADYESAEIRIREYVYKTNLEDVDGDPLQAWDDTMTEFGPTETLAAQMGDIWDDTEAPNVELIELTHIPLS